MFAPITILAAVLVVLAQGAATPAPKQAKPAGKLPAFPKQEPAWAIRGSVLADAELVPEKPEPAAKRELPVFPFSQERKKLVLGGVLVFVRGLEKKWSFDAPDKDEPVKVTLGANSFVPRVSAVVPGQVVSLKNAGSGVSRLDIRGPLFGMMFSLNKGAEILFEKQRISKMTLGASGIADVRVGVLPGQQLELNAPPRLKAVVHVLAHPVFAVTDENGRFSLPKLPKGKYEIVARDLRLGKLTKRLELDGKPRRPLRFVFHVPKRLRAEDDK